MIKRKNIKRHSVFATLVTALFLSVVPTISYAELFFETYECLSPSDDVAKNMCHLAKELNVSIESTYAGSTLSSIVLYADKCKFMLTPEFKKMQNEMLKEPGIKQVFQFNVEASALYGSEYASAPNASECAQRYEEGGPDQLNSGERPVVYR